MFYLAVLNETVSNLNPDNSTNDRLDDLENRVTVLEADLSSDSAQLF